MLICAVVGARPNFMKMAPVVLELARRGLPHLLVHTGQHYDEALSDVFFRELGLPSPDLDLGVGSGTHAEQTARVMTSFEPILRERAVDLVVVGGDVNSTLACALTAAKLGVPVAHVEAGLRSFDRSMPEEINRQITDLLSDLLFTTEESGNRNLRREGAPEGRVRFVGNCMVDSLLRHLPAARAREPWRRHGLEPGGYALLTLHRPSNVDAAAPLRRILDAMGRVGERLPVLFPVHPRTRERMELQGFAPPPRIAVTDPLPYLEFIGLMAGARLVLTDSGGIQEETTMLRVPCLTLRENTERPVTVELGTNRLVGMDPRAILAAVDDALAGRWPAGAVPPLWDGHAGERVADALEEWSLQNGGER